MRIAISGTHRIGKTSLAEAFVRTRPEFEFEPEPYQQLLEAGEELGDDLSPEFFHRQLAHAVARLSSWGPGDDVVCERCPLDFLAYRHAASSDPFGGAALDADPEEMALVCEGMGLLDVVAFLPLHDRSAGPGRMSSLRTRVDVHLRDLFALGPMQSGAPWPDVVELRGSTSTRLARLTERLAAAEPRDRR